MKNLKYGKSWVLSSEYKSRFFGLITVKRCRMITNGTSGNYTVFFCYCTAHRYHFPTVKVAARSYTAFYVFLFSSWSPSRSVPLSEFWYAFFFFFKWSVVVMTLCNRCCWTRELLERANETIIAVVMTSSPCCSWHSVRTSLSDNGQIGDQKQSK